mgnify:CR=1 FL=1
MKKHFLSVIALTLALTGCGPATQAVIDTGLNASTEGAKAADDRIASVALAARCVAPVGGAARRYTMQQLVNTLEDCGVDMSALRDELLKQYPMPLPGPGQ